MADFEDVLRIGNQSENGKGVHTIPKYKGVIILGGGRGYVL